MAVLKYKDPDTGNFIELGMYGVDSGAPVGASTYFHGTVIPTGWVVCDGTPHNSPPLERVIGSPNTPDLQDKFLLSAGPTYPPGSEGGAATHTLAEAEMPSHMHAYRWRGATSEDEPATFYDPTGGTHNLASANPNPGQGYSQLTAGTGGGAAHNNMPPYYAAVVIMKAWTSAAPGGITMEDADEKYATKVYVDNNAAARSQVPGGFTSVGEWNNVSGDIPDQSLSGGVTYEVSSGVYTVPAGLYILTTTFQEDTGGRIIVSADQVDGSFGNAQSWMMDIPSVAGQTYSASKVLASTGQIRFYVFGAHTFATLAVGFARVGS